MACRTNLEEAAAETDAQLQIGFVSLAGGGSGQNVINPLPIDHLAVLEPVKLFPSALLNELA